MTIDTTTKVILTYDFALDTKIDPREILKRPCALRTLDHSAPILTFPDADSGINYLAGQSRYEHATTAQITEWLRSDSFRKQLEHASRVDAIQLFDPTTGLTLIEIYYVGPDGELIPSAHLPDTGCWIYQAASSSYIGPFAATRAAAASFIEEAKLQLKAQQYHDEELGAQIQKDPTGSGPL